MERKKILVILTKLYMGGFSKSLINFLLCAKNYRDISFSILMLDDEIMELEKEIPENIEIIRISGENYEISYFNKFRLFYHKCKYVFFEMYYKYLLKKEINPKYVTEYAQIKNKVKALSLMFDFEFTKKYNAVISWQECYCNYVLAEKIPSNHKIGFIHPNYIEANFNKKIDKPSFKKLDKIITISKSCYDTLCEVFPKYKNKIYYIPNRLNYDNLVNKSKEYIPEIDKSCPTMLTVARIFDYNKAVFRIVDLAKKLLDDGLTFRWYIIGDGSDFDQMKKMIIDNNLSDFVLCLGEKVNPCPYMANVDLFVMQSHIEGRPVAVDEAVLLGIPALITEYSSAHEQIIDNKTGWIVKDNFDSIYNKLYKILSNEDILNLAKLNIKNIDKHGYEDCSMLINAALGDK